VPYRLFVRSRERGGGTNPEGGGFLEVGRRQEHHWGEDGGVVALVFFLSEVGRGGWDNYQTVHCRTMGGRIETGGGGHLGGAG